MKNKSWLTIYKNITKWEKKKHFSIITRNDFRFKNLGFVGVGLGHWTRWDAHSSLKNIFLLVKNRFLEN